MKSRRRGLTTYAASAALTLTMAGAAELAAPQMAVPNGESSRFTHS